MAALRIIHSTMYKVYISWPVSHDKINVGCYWGTHQEAFTSRCPTDDNVNIQEPQHLQSLSWYIPVSGNHICFDLYSGSISDKECFQHSDVLSLLERGDSVMGNQGFDIQDNLTPVGLKLNMPHTWKGKVSWAEMKWLKPGELPLLGYMLSVRWNKSRTTTSLTEYAAITFEWPS